MGLRQRKSSLLAALKAREIAKEVTPQQAEAFRLMYARARSEAEQDQVTAAVHTAIDGWKNGTDRLSRVLRNIENDDDDDDDPPSLRAALAKYGVDVGCSKMKPSS